MRKATILCREHAQAAKRANVRTRVKLAKGNLAVLRATTLKAGKGSSKTQRRSGQ
jgi:hypothetical protein